MTVNKPKEDSRADIGYTKLPFWQDVKFDKPKRAPEPSPLLKEYMKKQIEKLNGTK